MANFVGGSAFSMANQITEGYLLLNVHHLKRMSVNDIMELKKELDKIMRETRGDQPPLDQTELLQKRNRKIAKINQANMILNHNLTIKKRKDKSQRMG
jgi:hypothetical protein